MRCLNFALIGAVTIGSLVCQSFAARQMEYLDRGVVAVRQNNTNALVSWRSLATDNAKLAFNVYRETDGKATKLNKDPLTAGTNYVDAPRCCIASGRS